MASKERTATTRSLKARTELFAISTEVYTTTNREDVAYQEECAQGQSTRSRAHAKKGVCTDIRRDQKRKQPRADEQER